MRGFIVYPTYRVIDGKAFLHYYGRLENGESFLAIIERKAYFYIKKADQTVAVDTLPLEFEDVDFKNFDGEPVVRVLLDNPKDVPDARKMLVDKQIVCYEADILFAYRYLIDQDIKGSCEIVGQAYPAEKYNSMHSTKFDVDQVFLNPELKPADYFPDLKVLSFDIETDMKADSLYSISIVCGDYKKVLINKSGLYNNADSFDTEAEVLQKFMEIVKELDPDIITGWNCVDFDLQVLRKLYRHHKIDFKIGRDDSTMYIKVSDSFYSDSVAKVEGRVVLDGISMLKTSFIRLPDFKLQTAATHYTGRGKLLEGEGRFNEIEELYDKDPQKLIDYNLLDSELVLEILDKSNALNLTITRTKVTRMQLDRVRASIASLDSLYLRKLREIGVVAPTSFAGERDERIQGGYVRDSLPGIYENILVFDFKSLYPSIIRTFNIDPYTFVPEEKLDAYSKEEKKTFVVAPNGAHFRNEEGILPGIIQQLWSERDKAKKDKDDNRSYAIKILMNSFFGVLANPVCRFYSIEMGNAITHFGQFLIKMTADEAEKKGATVIYGDTDSIFIDLHEADYAQAREKGEAITKEINTYFTDYIKKEYGRESKMEIEFEKVYKKFFMPKARGTDVGAKKRYAGIIEKRGKEELDFVGLEFVRSDWTEIAKVFQLELLDKVFNKEKVGDYIRDFIKDIKAGKYDDKLVYRKSIRKAVSSYTKTTPPHIRAARKIGREDVGIIDYLITTDGPEEVNNVNNPLDYEHYIDKQIRPIAESVLEFYDEKFDDLSGDHKQNSLLDY